MQYTALIGQLNAFRLSYFMNRIVLRFMKYDSQPWTQLHPFPNFHWVNFEPSLGKLVVRGTALIGRFERRPRRRRPSRQVLVEGRAPVRSGTRSSALCPQQTESRPMWIPTSPSSPRGPVGSRTLHDPLSPDPTGCMSRSSFAQASPTCDRNM